MKNRSLTPQTKIKELGCLVIGYSFPAKGCATFKAHFPGLSHKTHLNDARNLDDGDSLLFVVVFLCLFPARLNPFSNMEWGPMHYVII